MAKKVQDTTSTIDANKQVLMDAFNSHKSVQAVQTDPTQQPQATTQADVEGQDARTRLWQSLNSTYGVQREQSDKNYDQAIANADRMLLSRGMQRSSYGAQTLANMAQEKVKASNDIMSNQIADYQNRLTSLEQQEQQFNYQKERDQIADQQWQQQFEAQKEQWKQQFDYQKMSSEQQIAYNYLMNMMEAGDNPSDALLKQAGISRSDYNQMKKAATKTGGGGGGRGGNGGNGDDGTGGGGDDDDAWNQLMNDLAVGTNAGFNGAYGVVTNGVDLKKKQDERLRNEVKYYTQQNKVKDRL